MSTLSRALGKAMVKSLDTYKVYFDQLTRCVDPVKPAMPKSHKNIRERLDNSFVNVCTDWVAYKRDTGLNEDEFNKIDDTSDVAVIEHNDAWFEAFKDEFYTICEKSDDKLEAMEVQKNGEIETKADLEDKVKIQQSKKQCEFLLSQIEAESDDIEGAMKSFESEVNNIPAGGLKVSKAMAYKSGLKEISERLNVGLDSKVMQVLPLLDNDESANKNTLYIQFLTTHRSRLRKLLETIEEKVEQNIPSNSYTDKPRPEQTFLKKTDPPKFEGDMVTYPDFRRKWKANVSKANLSAESELDRLRDNVPEKAAKMLFGEATMEGAWTILDKMFGNKTLIANQLKNQLKGIKASGTADHDIVINLSIEVKTIEKRLKELGLNQMLNYDDEYLSAVFKALPYNERREWLKYDKTSYTYEWEAMVLFLEQAREEATSTKVLLSSYGEQSDTKLICKKCGQAGHKKYECTVKINAARVSKVESDDTSDDEETSKNNEEKEKEIKRRVRERCGKCPICKKRHTFTRKKDNTEWPSDRLISCAQFQKMSPKDRAIQLEKSSGCSRCTSWCHRKSDCRMTNGRCGMDKNGTKCQSDHSRLVCGSGVAYCGNVKISSPVFSDSSGEEATFPDLDAETLLCYQEIKVPGAEEKQNSCFDNGRNRCLVANEFARDQQLDSQMIRMRLNTPGCAEKIEDTQLYTFHVEDNYGVRTKIWAFGVDQIMPDPSEVNLMSVRHLFPHLPASAFDTPPTSKVQILIGNNFLALHPSGGQGKDSVDNLRVLSSNFGSGWVVAGAHPSLDGSGCSLSVQALAIARINRCHISPMLPTTFWESECLGVLPEKRCGRCLQCSTCSDLGLLHSRKEQEDLDAIRQGVKLVDGEIRVQYQFQKDPKSLPNNRNVAIKIADKLEKRLENDGHLEYYNQELKKYFERGAAVKLTDEEINSWQGPVNYISHHGGEQDSVSTPLRIVTNSSLKNGGKSLNDCLITGPKSLNSMFDIMLRFRCHECGLVFDLTKAYNCLKTGPVERHLRRFIWRFSQDEPWMDFAFDCVAFGDCPAANCLEIGRDMTAEAGRGIDPIAADKIINDSYVDDGVTGGTRAEVERMKGERLGAGCYSGTLGQILDKGKLKMKVVVTTGEHDKELTRLIGDKVLGYNWDTVSDGMSVSLPVNITKKKTKKLRSGPDLTVESLDLLRGIKLSRRLCLGIASGFLDFLGIACPFTLRFKLLMKQIYEDKDLQLSWDDELPGQFLAPWIDLITETVMSDSICFPRTTKPSSAQGNPWLVTFGDGAFPAFSAAVYVRWQVSCSHEDSSACDGDFISNLLCAKAKVTPSTGFTIPRSELSSCVLQSRLALTSVKALQTDAKLKPVGVTMLSDSRCSISAVEKSTSALKPFFHNRVGEILDNIAAMRKYCLVEDIHHVSGDLNPADLATRGLARAAELGPGSFWQLGPSFLSLRRELWPVSREFVLEQLPPEEVRTKKAVICALLRASVQKNPLSEFPDLWRAVDRVLHYSNNIVKVKRILARVVRVWKCSNDVKAVFADPQADELAEAERLLLVSAMVDTAAAFYDQKLESLMPERDGMVIVTRGRLGEDCLSAHLGVSALPVLMSQSRAAYLYMERAHCGEFGTEHKSVTETLARSRTSVWIHRGRDLAKKICKNCPLCMKNKKKLCGQQMAKIRPEGLVVCRPWTFVSLDFAGPYKVRGVVNSRARMKCWVLVYVCRSTKAVCLLATCGYSTQSFLLRHAEFVARMGAPSKIVSDRGVQLVSAGIVLAGKESPGKWDWKRVTRDNSTSSWEFVPIGSQHRNGLPEATVKVLKKSLAHALHPGVVLAYDELVTLLSRISYSINQRPLGLANTSQSSQQEDNMVPLTPNMMLLGRSSNESPPLDYSEDDRFCSRLSYVSTVETTWWKKWVKEVLPTLLPYTRWRKQQKNLSVGDVVMMWYTGNMKDHYRLARIVEVFPDQKGLVRTVRVKYRKKNMKEPKTVCSSKNLVEEKVSVQRLQLLESTSENPVKEVGQEDTGEEEFVHEANDSEVDVSVEEVEVSKDPLKVKVKVNDEDYEVIVDIFENKVKKKIKN